MVATRLSERRLFVALNLQNGNRDFDTVRGAYIEGTPVYPGAKIFDETHIQICVLNTKCVLGYFVPTQIEKYYFKK